MPSYETAVDIEAPPRAVWTVTCDVESWPDWSPTMDEVTRTDTGPIAVGSTALLRQPALRPATWVVDDAATDRSFVWHTAGPGYRITASHLFEPVDDRTATRLAVWVTGPLAPVVWALSGRKIRRYVDEEAAALKRRCELTP